jgi:hypothetical protein
MGTRRLQFRFVVPFCGPTLILWPYGTKAGFAEKQFFSLRKIVFSHMLGLPPIHSKSQGIELGT